MSRKFCIDKFWNNTKFLNQKYPIFTECFQFSILIIPCIIFDTSFLIYIACKMYKSQRIMKVPFDIWHILKLGIHCLIIALLVMEILMDWQNSISNLDEIYIISYVLLCSTIVFVIIHTEIRRQTMHPVCIILFIFWFSITLAYLIKFYNNIIQSIQSKVTIYFIKSILLSGGIFLLFLISFLIECFPRFSPDWILINKKIPCPEEYASIISKLTYSWLDKYIYNWFKHEMTDQTSFDLQREDESLKSINEVEKVFLAKISKYKLTKRNVEELDILSSSANLLQDENKTMKDEIKRPGFILFCSLLKIFKYKIFISWSFKLIHDIFIYLSPFLLKILLETVKDKNSIAWISYIFAFCFLFCGLISSLSENLCFFISWRVSIRVRAALIGMLYKKTLRLSNEERNKYTSGEIVNLMSIDTERIMTWVNFSWYIFSCPFQIIAAIILLYKEIGYSVFSGVGVIIFFFLLNGIIMKFLQKYSEAELGWKDKRIKILTEILNGIKILKMYAWERSFLKKITKLREEEMKYIMRVTSGWSCVSCIWESLPILIILISFLTFIFVDITNVLTAEKAFVCLTICNLITYPMIVLPWGLIDTVNIFVSMKRIGEFLVGTELDNSERYHDDDTIGPKSPDDVVVKICHGSFSWKKDEKIILNNINLEINRGKLLAIVGKIGTGKSSLLSAILGEMHKITGSIKIEGKIAFVSQEAWIQNKSLKENILFTKAYDEESYNKIIEACSLISDFDQLPARDETEIGERGINLSGGQKQRVSLARSVYQNHDIYLLDDPLSAVDVHVGEHLFNNVISNKGILNGKTRIMVTHGLHWLPKVDEIIVLDSNGSVSERGTFKDLLRSDGNEFMQFIQEYIENLKGNTDESVELNDDSEISEAVKLLKKVSESKDVEEEFLGLVLNNDIISKRKIYNSKDKERTLSEESRKSTELINGLLSKSFTEKRHQISPGSLEKGRIFARQMSLETSIKTDNTNLQNDLMIKPLGYLTDEETTMTGEVKLKTYFMYVKSRGLKLFVTTILIYILYIAIQINNNLWLKQFTEDPFIQNATSELLKNTSYSPEMSTIIREKTKFYMLVYTGIGMGMIFMLVLYWIGNTIGTVNASKRLHKILLYRILRSPMKFFDTTPSGRIINRFSKDIENIDHTMPMNLSDMICCFFQVVGSICIIIYVTPWFSIIIIPLIILYYLIQLFYMPSSRQARRLDSISSSPIFSNFTETIQGLAVIRAFGEQKYFQNQNQALIDKSNKFKFIQFSVTRWLSLRIDTLGNLVVFSSVLFAIIDRKNLSTGMIGLSISYALHIVEFLNWLIKQYTELETNSVAMERIREYSMVPSEAQWDLEKTRKENWPSFGNITFENYDLRYRENLPLVLKNINLKLYAGEKIGIVGRTGAGKSSLNLALFRLVEPANGTIKIDDVDISTLGLHDLRKNITILPQEPVIFCGTVRENLDPFNVHTENELYQSLETAHLKDWVSSLPEGIDYECGEGGANLSVGQKQLLCLSRALLRKSKVLILDEVTASVDVETDGLVMQTIKDYFKFSTIIIIAHRINTILDTDRIVVMDNGKIVEIDTPSNLLAMPSGIFKSLHEQSIKNDL